MSELALRLIAENKAKHQRGEDARSLDLGNCGLTEVPEEAGDCVWLEELTLSSTWLEYDLDKKLWIDYSSKNIGIPNRIAFLNPAILKLTNLKKLVVAGMEEEWYLSDLSNLSSLLNLQTLICYATKIIDLLPISGLLDLRHLYCFRTQIEDLTPLSGLKNLQKLDCSFTEITNLGPLSGLKNLRQLDCSSTRIADLSPLSEIKSLQKLSFHSTKVCDLSPLSGLVNLKQLSFHTTEVVDISPLFDMVKLEHINCFNTEISNISPLFGHINLKKINCFNTKISDISPILHLIEKGRTVEWSNYKGDINVENCPLIIPPFEIVIQGNNAVLNYFRKREQGVEKIKEAKLLILGEGGAGKTTLARKILKGFREQMPTEQESTHGIEIADFQFPCFDGKKFNMHVWDFGGQEIYHSTHQFFLTKRSLYLLVADVRKEDTNFDYWLEVVELLSDNSPVLIVQNRRGGRSKDMDFAGLRGRFANLKGVISIDLSHEEPTFEELMHEIRDLVQKLPHTNEEWPVTWARMRESLEALKQSGLRYITLERYLDLCVEQDLDEADALSLSHFLHDFGVFLHFQDDMLLKRTIFLDNIWVTAGVYAVLDDAKVIENKGYFTAEDAKNIWKTEAYRHMSDEFLQLMHKFEVSYRLSEGRVEHNLVPHLLSAQSPLIDWDDTGNLQLHYDYVFMPKGILGRLMVRLHRYLLNPKQEAWRSGAVFHRQGAKAKLVENYRERSLHLRATGTEAKALVTLISEEIDLLNSGYHGLKVQKLVPCNCLVCKGLDQPHFYKYDNLLRRKEQGKATVECEISFDNISVLRLIDDVFITTFFVEQPKKVFISYSKQDKTYLEQLKNHLAPLRKLGLLQTWDDTELVPGEEWDASIRRELNAADIIILLVSADLMATDYVWNIEMKEAVERHARGQATVIPVIVRPSLWEDAPFAKLTAIPEKGKPISTWPNPDEAWAQVGVKIKQIANRKKI